MLSGDTPTTQPPGDDMLSGRGVSRRSGERGFTLIELLISMGLLGIVAGAVAAAFGVGVRALAPGGSQARLSGAHDLSFLEQLLGKDGARASCLTANQRVYGDNVTLNYSTCHNGTTPYGKVQGCTSPTWATLCFGWPAYEASTASWTCHVAVYTTGQPSPPATPAAGSNVVVTRKEFSVGPPPSFSGASTPLGSVTIDRFDTVTFQVGSAVTYAPPNESYTWVRSVPVTITATGVSQGQFGQQLSLHPVATDPSGGNSALTTQNSPC